MANEVKVLKSNTLEQWRQKTNEVSFDLGDNSQLDTTRLSDKVYTYTATTANGGKFLGNDNNSDSLVFSVLPDVSLDNTGGYIILKNGTSIPASFAVGDTLSQSGGFSCTLEAISIVDSKPKLLVKNTSGTFNAGEDLTDQTGTIAHANIIRQISESYSVGSIRVLKNSAELVQDLSSDGYHVIPLAGSVPLSGSPSIVNFHEGDTVYQGSNLNTATWSGTLYHATSTQLLFKTVTGSFSASVQLKNTSTSDTIAGTNHGNITNYTANGFGVELNTPAANTNTITVVATDLVDAVNELQDDIGTVENLTQGSADLVTAINDHESDIGNMTLTGLSATDLSAAARELRTELGDVTEINDATGYSATTSVGGIKEIQGDIGDVTGLNTTHNTTLVGAINEIEGVFDASTHEISAGSNAFNIISGQLILNSSADIILDADGGDIKLYNDGSSNQFGALTDSSGNLVIKSGSTTMLTGSGANATFAGTVTAVGTSVFTNLDISGNVDIDGSLETDALSINGTTVSSTAAELNKLDGATLSTSELNILDGATLSTSELNILDGVTASAADINLIDGITNGTVIASKAIITDSNKDITGGRNITISGELDAVTLDISGNADIDGTLALGSLTNVETSITDLQSDVGSNNFAGGTLLNSLGGTSNLTVAIKTLESEIGEDADYASGTITYGASTISGVLVNLNNELDALNSLQISSGSGLSGGGNLTTNRTLSVNVDDSSIEIHTNDKLRVKASGITNAMLAGSISQGKLAGNISNGKLANSTITISAESGTDHAIALGETLTVSAGAGINTNINNNTLQISAELATETNAGVATFDGTDFTVTSGDVTLNDERIEDIVGAMVSGGTEDGISVTYVDNGDNAGKLSFDIDDNTVLRLAGTQTVSGNKTFTGSVDLSNATVTFGSGGSVQNFNTQFLTLNADTNTSGLRIDRSANTSATVTTTIDPDFFWDETQVGTGSSNTSHRAWRLKGFSNASTPIANTADVVTFYNAKDLVSASNSSGITPTFTMNTGTAGEHQGIWDFDVNVDNLSIEVSSDNLQVKAGGITNAMLAGSIAASKLAGSIPNSKISNPNITIGDSTIALGGTDTTLTGLTDIDLTSGNKTIFDGVGNNDLTIGASNTKVIIAGDFQVDGTTTTLNTTTLDVEDKNITLNKGGDTNSANGAGITVEDAVDGSTDATILWDGGNDRWSFSHDVVAPNFRGNGQYLTSLPAGELTGTIADARLPNSITSSITGNAATATQVYVTENNTGNNNLRVLFHDGTNSGNSGLEHDDDLLYNPATNVLTAGTFNGNIAWTNVTGKPAVDNYQHWTLSADTRDTGISSDDNIISTETVAITGGNAISTLLKSGGVEIKVDSDSIALDELNVNGTPANGKVIEYNSGNLQWGTVSTTDNYADSVSFSGGTLTIGRTGSLSDLSVSLDGRYSQTDTVTRLRGTTSGSFVSGDITLAPSGATSISQSGNTITVSSTNTTYSAGVGLVLAGTTFKANLISETLRSVTAESITTTGSRTYAVMPDADGDLVVNVPWTDTNTQTPARAAGVGLSLNGNTIDANVDGTNSVSPNTSTNTSGRTYKVQVDSSDNLVVNVPWSDTDTIGTDTVDMGDGFKVANAGGTDQFTVVENEEIRFAASGSAGVSFDASTQKVTYSATNTVTQIRRDNTGTYRTSNINLVGGSNVTITEPSPGTFSFASTDTVGTDTVDMGDGFKVADNAGNEKFTVTENEEIRFVGTGATSVSFESSPQRITINSTDTDTNNYITGLSFNTSNGILTASRLDLSNLTVDLDGRYLEGVNLGTNHNTTTVEITNDSGNNATINAATTSLAGVMTKDDKAKLNGIASGAQVNQNAFSTFELGTYSVGAGGDDITANSASTEMNLYFWADSFTTAVNNTSKTGTVRLKDDQSDNIYQVGRTGAGYVKIDASTNNGVDFVNTASGSSIKGRITSAGVLHMADDIIAFSTTTTSDVKLKENIERVEGALDKVAQLDGVTFNWKKDGKASAGVIAQNVEEVLPSAVKEVETLDGQEINKHVDYNQLSALFIEAIKELKEENKLLKAEIEGLKSINS